METVAQKTKRVIASTLGIERNYLMYNTNLVSEYGLDSIDRLELITVLEKEFNITIPDERIARMQTVGDFVEFFEKTKIFPVHQLMSDSYRPRYSA